MKAKNFHDKKDEGKCLTQKGELYDFEISLLPQVGERKSYGVYPIGSVLVKFAQMDRKKFFSYEVRFTPIALKEMGINEPEDFKTKSLELALEVLEKGCRDDMVVTVDHDDDYIAASSEVPLQKHYKKRFL